MTDKRVSFDFDVAFSNGGDIQAKPLALDTAAVGKCHVEIEAHSLVGHLRGSLGMP